MTVALICQINGSESFLCNNSFNYVLAFNLIILFRQIIPICGILFREAFNKLLFLLFDFFWDFRIFRRQANRNIRYSYQVSSVVAKTNSSYIYRNLLFVRFLWCRSVYKKRIPTVFQHILCTGLIQCAGN